MIGQRLGPYEVVAKLGEGGMGQVYRARDTKLGRDVALKVLPESFAADADRLARFRREAQVLASLNHPGIAAIYGFEDSGATHALVLELVEGPTLADRISQGAIPLTDALPIARQIADALEAAHEQGIVHRDLKPANIKVRDDGTVKVLDFGLAKALGAPGSEDPGLQGSAANSPTLTARATQMGMILGTAAYMAPEQARGRAVDRRADIWAFGVVLYEMLTGRRAFEGEDISITLASVLKEDVTWTALPAELPASVRRLLRRCLEKDPKRRLSAIGDARLELEETTESSGAPVAAPVPTGPRWQGWVWPLVAGVASAAAIYFAFRPSAEPTEPAAMARFTVPPPGTANFTGAIPRFGVSPDGRFITFAAASQPGKPDQLWIRRLDATDATMVPGAQSTAEAVQPQSPFWSPDSKTLAFFMQVGLGNATPVSRLLKVDLQGGGVQPIGDFPSNNAGGSWNRDGVILIGTQGTKGIQRIPSGGGVPAQVTALDASRQEVAHLWPQFLPDGRHFIYMAWTPNRADWATYVGSIDSPDRRKLVDSEYARIAAPDTLLFLRSGNLFAQTMDLGTRTLTGEPVLVVSAIGSMANGRAGFAVSDTGVLVYSTELDQTAGAGDRRLTWVDRTGKPIETVGPPISGATFRLSPDATQAVVLEPTAAGTGAPARHLWVVDLERPVKVPLATDRAAVSPTWSADGKVIRFASADDVGGRMTIAERAANGATPAKPVYDGPGLSTFPLDETQDGTLLFAENSPGAILRGLRFLTRTSGGKPATYLSDSADRLQASISRDGRWLAYASNESGTYQIFVQPFPDATQGKTPISTGFGLSPRWRRDGRELFYLDAEQRLVAVEISTSPLIKVGKSTPLFTVGTLLRGLVASGAYVYDVHPDGQRFLVSAPASGGDAVGARRVAPLMVVTNWTSLLKK